MTLGQLRKPDTVIRSCSLACSRGNDVVCQQTPSDAPAKTSTAGCIAAARRKHFRHTMTDGNTCALFSSIRSLNALPMSRLHGVHALVALVQDHVGRLIVTAQHADDVAPIVRDDSDRCCAGCTTSQRAIESQCMLTAANLRQPPHIRRQGGHRQTCCLGEQLLGRAVEGWANSSEIKRRGRTHCRRGWPGLSPMPCRPALDSLKRPAGLAADNVLSAQLNDPDLQSRLLCSDGRQACSSGPQVFKALGLALDQSKNRNVSGLVSSA